MEWMLPAKDTYFAPVLARTPEGFELDHLEFALKQCKQFGVAIDGGAHIGTWTVALAKRFARVIAFEPALDTYLCLTNNTKHLHNVVPFNAALGARTGIVGVVDDPTRKGNTGARQVDPSGEGVFLHTIDSLKLSVDFIKLDVEGFELYALQGAEFTLRIHKPTVMVECKKFNPPRYGGPQAAISFLLKLGYKHVGGVGNDQVFVYDR